MQVLDLGGGGLLYFSQLLQLRLTGIVGAPILS